MADTSKLRDMLQDLINDRQEQASMNLHDYLVDKMQDISGSKQAATEEESETEVEELNLDTTD